MKKKPDAGSTITITATFVLFTLALFIKGIGKELLLEAGVLLVSIKLIQISHQNASESQSIREDLRRIQLLLQDRAAVATEESGNNGQGL